MLKLHLNPRFSGKLGRLKKGAFARLESQLLEDVSTEPIFYWFNPKTEQDEILDGHHRYEIAIKNNLELETHEKFFESEDDAMSWVLYHQITRRNVGAEEKQALLQEAIALAKKETKTVGETVTKAAEILGVSEPTIYRGMAKEKGLEELKQDFLTKTKEYELKIAKRKGELLKSAVSQAKESGQDLDETIEEELREQLESEFAGETETLERESEELQEKVGAEQREQQESNQVIRRGSGSNSSSTKPPTVESQKKKALKQIRDGMDKLQNGIAQTERLYDEFRETAFRVIPFRKLYEILEEYEVPLKPKSRYGKK